SGVPRRCAGVRGRRARFQLRRASRPAGPRHPRLGAGSRRHPRGVADRGGGPVSRDPLSPELPDVFEPPPAPPTPELPHEAFAPRRIERMRTSRIAPRRRDTSSRLGTLRPGTIIDKYRIEELLGVGGFAAVYRATHLLLQSTVALKLLR